MTPQGVANGLIDRDTGVPLRFRDAGVEQLGSYLVAQRKKFDDPCAVLTDAYDASTMGSPAEDTMLYAITDGTCGAWSTPMVLETNTQASLPPPTFPQSELEA